MRKRGTLRQKIVLPFFVLLAFVGMAGTLLITSKATGATVAQFEGSLLRASLLSNDHLAVLEAERLAQLRAAIDTQGVTTAIAKGDATTLTSLLRPLQANAFPDQLTIRVLDAKGNELLTLTPAGAGTPSVLGAQPDVRAVLAGQVDPKGDKFVFTQREPSGVMLYWIGPARNDANNLVGAVLLGESMTEVADRIRDSRASDLIFYDQSGGVLLSSLPGVSQLSSSVLGSVATNPVRISQALAGHPFEFLVANWKLRSNTIGYLAVAEKSDTLLASISQIRLLMLAVFAVAALMTLLFGSLLARRITRPVEQLVASTTALSAGNLSHRSQVATNDEIGVLAQSFNVMASNLEEKTQELEESYFASIETLARAIDARDPYTFGHSARVAAISQEIGEVMGLPAEDRKALRRSALLHDIGKIGVEDRILRKAGSLTEAEWDAMKQHPFIGYKMLSGLKFLRPSLAGVLHHHERWDGGGYPAGLREDGIIPYVRILSLADTLDAMTSDRPYRQGFPFEKALQEIRKLGGTQLDPRVVEAFLWRSTQISALLLDKSLPTRQTTDLTWLEKAA